MRVIVIILLALVTVSALTYCSNANTMRVNEQSAQVILKSATCIHAGRIHKVKFL